MKNLTSMVLTVAICFQTILCGALLSNGVFAQTQEVLTNQTVVEMTKANLPADVIAAKIKASNVKFDTSATALQDLKKAGVSDSVITAIMNKTAGTFTAVLTNAVATAPGKTVTLEDKTPVKLRLNRTLTSADAKIGDNVDFEVIEDVKVGELVVIPRGSIALATIANARPRGRMGKAGKLDVVIDSVKTASGEKALLRASKETAGKGSTGAMTGAIVATSIVFFPAAPLFLLMKGKDITIPKGTEITAYVNGNTTLDSAKFSATGLQK